MAIGCSDAFTAQPRTDLCESPSAPACGKNSICTDTDHPARCECTPGFTGPKCDKVCPAAEQDNDGDGTCKPACGSPSAVCGLHATCTDTSGAAICKCVVGYTGAPPQSTCSWSGVIQDPDFTDTPAGAWKVTNAKLSKDKASDLGKGVVEILNADTLTEPARVAQKFSLPALADSEALRLRLAYHLTRTSTGGLFGFAVNTLRVRTLGRPLATLQNYFFTNGFQERDICLGARWYGREHDFAIESAGGQGIEFRPFGAPRIITAQNVDLDRVNIDVAPNCPRPGVIANANFEDSGAWIASATAPALSEVAAVSGLTGNAARLSAPDRCQNPSIQAQLSPLEGAQQSALTFKYKGSAGDFAIVSVGGVRLARLSGSSVVQSVSICLPEDLKGVTSALTISLPTLAACAGARDWGFDDFALAPNAACKNPHLISNANFEEPIVNYATWLADPIESNAIEQPGDQSSFGGRLFVPKACSSMSLNTAVSLPVAATNEGIAVKFRAKLQGSSLPTTKVRVNLQKSADPLTLTSAWSDQTVCLTPGAAGGVAELGWNVYIEAADCAPAATAALNVDNVSFVSLPECK
jgi:hypothetical protein